MEGATGDRVFDRHKATGRKRYGAGELADGIDDSHAEAGGSNRPYFSRRGVDQGKNINQNTAQEGQHSQREHGLQWSCETIKQRRNSQQSRQDDHGSRNGKLLQQDIG